MIYVRKDRNYIKFEIQRLSPLRRLHRMQLFPNVRNWCNVQLHHICSYGPTSSKSYLERTNLSVFTHIPQLDCSVLSTAEQLVRVLSKADRHDRLLMSLEWVYHSRLIKHSNHIIFESSNQYMAIWCDSTWDCLYRLVEIWLSAWNWVQLTAFWDSRLNSTRKLLLT